MWVVVSGDNTTIRGKGYKCDTKEDGEKKLTELHRKAIHKLKHVDNENTYIMTKEGNTYGQVSDGLFLKFFWLLEV